MRIQCDDLDGADLRRPWRQLGARRDGLGGGPAREDPDACARPPADTADNWVEGVVRDIAYMGDMSIYLLKLDSGKIVRVTQPNVYRHADDAHHLGRSGLPAAGHAYQPRGGDQVSIRCGIGHGGCAGCRAAARGVISQSRTCGCCCSS